MYGFPPGTERQEDGQRPFQPPSTSVYCMIDGKTACKRWHFALQKVTFYMAKCRQSPCNQRPFRGFSAVFRPFFCYFCCTLQRSFNVTLSMSSSCVCTLLLSVFPPKGFLFPSNGLLQRQQKSRCQPSALFRLQMVRCGTDGKLHCVLHTFIIPFKV